MASVKNLKKDINFILGDIIEAVYLHELTSAEGETEKSEAIIKDAIEAFDQLTNKISGGKKAENKKAYFNQIDAELEQTANQLIERINAL